VRVSVVICTLNRADALAATLECLQYQHHDDFEVIVVNGPSTDGTLEVLAPWRRFIRYRDNPEQNLSKSRNIGIRASTGELLAFIDDDALPEPEWLTQAIPAFDDPEVAGAGGIVFDHTGMGLQYRYSATDRLCRAVHSDRDSSLQCYPGTFQFPYLQGTNQIYRRGPLIAAGGFDENIFFYGDDCDICGRLIDAGWVIRQLPTSAVHHKYLPSGIRDHQRITTNWFPVVHDKTYYCLRHASAYMSEAEVLHHIHEFMHGRVADTQYHQDGGRLSPGSVLSAEATCMRAFVDGYRAAIGGLGTTLLPLAPEQVEFMRFPTVGAARRRKLLFVSSSYTGNITGGIGRLFSDLAPAMAARGHDVRVVTRATGSAAVDFEDSVWVHRIEAPVPALGGGVAPDVLPQINAFATAALKEVQRIREWIEPDLVFAPLWDVEAIGILRETDLPVAIHVSTPVAVIGPMAGFLRHDGTDPPELLRLLELESEVLDTADVFQANTVAVRDTIRSNYARSCEADRWQVVNIGLKDRALAATPHTRAPTDGRTVFFAGRFESRKGIDTLLEAMERVLPDYSDLRLVLAGEDRQLAPGLPPVGASFLDRHRRQPWIDRVTMLGVVGDETLHEHYANADLVVLPSRYESFGLVMVEAMMHGKPLVTADTSGVREVVRDGVDGLLVEPGNVDQLERAIRRLLDNPAHAEALGTAARERFLADFSIDRVAHRFELFFERLGKVSSGEQAQRRGGRALASGERATIGIDDRAAATVVVRAEQPSRLRVIDGRERVVELAVGAYRRMRLDAAVGEATFVVDQGAVVIKHIGTFEPSTSPV
jgi:glycosyltransferase involved in cell wall biosynthesis/GT2 family glycosyltransferase